MTKAKVLIVDDDQDVLTVLSLHFQHVGAEVTAETDPIVAKAKTLKSLKDGDPFDMLIIDIRMPHLNGFDLTRGIREAGYKGAIIAFTSTASGEGRKTSGDAGITTYLSKQTLNSKLALALLEEHCPRKN